ncbi:phage tail sheath family protein [Kribbella sp. CA-253562]|uniref:phage tail sheath family protein n=1 Tax=Kribbella sp. CA-253562 TaxID=3239942 RepID=UPI003D8DC769
MPTYLSPGVYVEEVEAGSRPIEGVGTSVAAFVGFAEKGPVNTPTLVTNWTQFSQTFGEFVPGSYLAHAVYGYMSNGGSSCYVVRVGSSRNERSKHGAQKQVSATPTAMLGGYRVLAIGRGGGAEKVSVEVADSVTENPPDGAVRLVVRAEGKSVEEYDPVVFDATASGTTSVLTVVNNKSKLIRLEQQETSHASLVKVEKGTQVLEAPAPASPAEAGSVGADDYVGDAAQRTGFSALEAIDDVTMVAVPDLMSAYQQGAIDLETVHAVQQAVISHCELMGDRMAILDPPPGLNAQQVKQWRVEGAGYDSKYAALYWPWTKVFDPASGRNIHVPPSGHVAGVWARTDEERGVHKAPANEVVRGAIDLETTITKAEHDLLNPVGVNCIRSFPGRGIRIWGARTLSSDPAWRYVNVRRLFNYLEESVLQGTQWVVFEPNDDALWARIRRTISAFLVNEWRKGALFGLTPEEAFYVKCDRETNPAEAIDAGQVTCQIGIAPVKPAEFVVFQLSQFSGGTSVVSE